MYLLQGMSNVEFCRISAPLMLLYVLSTVYAFWTGLVPAVLVQTSAYSSFYLQQLHLKALTGFSDVSSTQS